MILGACAYLTAAIRRVYETKRWTYAAGKAIFINVGYVAILMMLLFVIFIVSIAIVAIQAS